MAFVFEGDFEVDRDRADVFEFLSDPDRFGPLLPGFVEVQSDGEAMWRLKLKVGVSQIRGAADIRLRLEECRRPERAVYGGQGKVGAGTLDFTAGFDLKESDTGTQVLWRGEMRIAGTLKSLAGGLLRPLANRNIQKLIHSLQEALRNAPKR